jgi:hypothetical protein
MHAECRVYRDRALSFLSAGAGFISRVALLFALSLYNNIEGAFTII